MVMADLNEEKVKKIGADIDKETGNATLAMKIDFTVESEIEEFVKQAVAKFGKISGVINNVGWGSNTPLFG